MPVAVVAKVAVFEQPLDVCPVRRVVCVFPFVTTSCRPFGPYSLTYHHFEPLERVVQRRRPGRHLAPGGYAVGVKLAVHEVGVTLALLVSNLVDGRLGVEMLGNRLMAGLSHLRALNVEAEPPVGGRSVVDRAGHASGPA